MKHLIEYLFEHHQDSMPKLVIIIGGPGAGKTYWMTEHSIEKKDEDGNVIKDKNGKVVKVKEVSGFKTLFGSTNVSKLLDMDHNLEQVQKENARDIAKILITGIHLGATRAWFNQFIAAKQQDMDDKCERGNSPKVDLSQIDFDFIISLVESYVNNKQNLPKLQERFIKEYWKKIFASDFSRRSQSKETYNKTYINKLKGIISFKDGDEMYADEHTSRPSDVCLAITGDELSKFEKAAALSDGRHAIYVVYLDIPEKMSIEADKKRDRTVGEEMVKKILAGVHKTWEELKQEYENIGIWKMYHLTTPEGEHPKWEVNEIFTNKRLLKSSQYRN